MVRSAGKRAGAQQHGKIVGALGGEIAGNLAGAAEDRLADLRRRDHLVVEDDGKQLADILLRRLAEALGALGVEAEGNDRLAGRWSNVACASTRFSPETMTRFSIR